MQLVGYAKRLSTEFRMLNTEFPRARCLMAAPAPGELVWAVRSQTHEYDTQGGYSARDPFRNSVRLKDWWQNYPDYTLTKEEAIERLLTFESDYPIPSLYWDRDPRIPHVLDALDGPWSRLRR